VAVLAVALVALPPSVAAQAAMPLSVDVVRPPSSGVQVIQLEAAADQPTPSAYRLLQAPSNGTVFPFDPTQAVCDFGAGAIAAFPYTLTTGADGRLCYQALEVDPAVPEAAVYETSIRYAALSASGAGSEPTADNTADVTVYVYTDATCPTLPELDFDDAASGSVPQPTVTVGYTGGQRLTFTVDAAYLGPDGEYLIDFYPFSTDNGDTADGAGRTCGSLDSTLFAAQSSFADWWQAAPHAQWPGTTAVGNGADYPAWATGGQPWTIEATACDRVQLEASFTVGQLAYGGCSAANYPQQPAVTSTVNAAQNRLEYSGVLHVTALQPRDAERGPSAGYLESRFEVPFEFALEQVVESIEAVAAKWNFEVRVSQLNVVYTGEQRQLLMTVETLVSDPDGGLSPLLDNEQLLGFPLLLDGKQIDDATISGTYTSPDCNTANPCMQQWLITVSELPEDAFDGDAQGFAQQYTGDYLLEWADEDGDPLVATVTVEVSAEDPAVDLGVGGLPARLEFFADPAEMQLVESGGEQVSEFTNGMSIWARHTLEVADEDASSFEFHLRRAWVCYSAIAGFAPALDGPSQGCRVDIPGVMEASLNQRRELYNEAGGLLAPTEAALAWQKIGPVDGGWEGGRTVHNGFKVAALPLADGAEARDYYFHVISEVTERSGGGGGGGNGRRSLGMVEHVVHYKRQSDGSVSGPAEALPNGKAQLQSLVVRGDPEPQPVDGADDNSTNNDDAADGPTGGGNDGGSDAGMMPIVGSVLGLGGVAMLVLVLVLVVRRRRRRRQRKEGHSDKGSSEDFVETV
jgi:hypothetical protein